MKNIKQPYAIAIEFDLRAMLFGITLGTLILFVAFSLVPVSPLLYPVHDAIMSLIVGEGNL
jgi:hypothetical protein